MKKYLVYFLIIVGSLMIPVNAASAQDFISSPTVVDGVLVTYQPPEGEVAQKCSAGWAKVEADGKPDPSNPDREVTYDLTIPSDGQYELLIAAYGLDRNADVHNAGMYALWNVAGQESVTTIPDTMMAVITWHGVLTSGQSVTGIYRYGTYPDEPYTDWGITYQLCLVRVADLPTLTPTPSQTPLPTATSTPTPTATSIATNAPTATATLPVNTATATATPSATATAGLGTPVTLPTTETVTPTTTVVAGTATPTLTSTPCDDNDPGCTTNIGIGQTPEPVDDGKIYLPMIRAGYDFGEMSWLVLLLVVVLPLLRRRLSSIRK